MTSILIRTAATALLLSATVANASYLDDSAEVDASLLYDPGTAREWHPEYEASLLSCAVATANFEEKLGEAFDALEAFVECMNTNDGDLSQCGATDNDLIQAIAEYKYAEGQMNVACS